MEIAKGRALDDILAERCSIAEGVNTAKVAVGLAAATGVELPIAIAVEQILFHQKSPEKAIGELMERELKAERWS